MADPDAALVDGKRFGDLPRVGDNRVAREPHIFLAAGGARRGKKKLQGGMDLDLARRAVCRGPFDDARSRSEGAPAREARPFAQSCADVRRRKNDLRPIGLDQGAELVFGERRIDERDRVTRRGRSKQADHGFASVAAEEKDKPLSLGGDVFGEPKARFAQLLARQPDVAAIIASRRRPLERRDQRQKSAA